MQSLWSNQFKFISPADIKEAVGRIKVEFAGRDQQVEFYKPIPRKIESC